MNPVALSLEQPKVGYDYQLQVLGQRLLPGYLPHSFRRRFYGVLHQTVRNCAGCQLNGRDSTVRPGFRGSPNPGLRSPCEQPAPRSPASPDGRSCAGHSIGDEFPVPSQKRLGRDNGCQLRKHLVPSSRALVCEAATLVIRKSKPAVAELSTEDSVLLAQVLDRALLPLIHPSGDGHEHKSGTDPRLQQSFCRLPSQSTTTAKPQGHRPLSIRSGFGYYGSGLADLLHGGRSDAALGIAPDDPGFGARAQ